jgi:hypothetical protein
MSVSHAKAALIGQGFGAWSYAKNTTGVLVIKFLSVQTFKKSQPKPLSEKQIGNY